MSKLVVLLSVLVALVAAKPSGLAFTGPIVADVPAAISHQARVDVVSKPVVAAYAAPALVAAPVAYTAPVVQKTILAAPLAVPAAVSHQARVDIHAASLITKLAYAAHIPAAVPIPAAYSVHPY